MESTGKGGGGDSVGGVDGECTRLAEVVSYTDSSEALLAPSLVGRDWSGSLGDSLLKFSTIVADAVTSFRHM